MPIIPDDADRKNAGDANYLSDDDLQLMDLLALHVICGTLREVRR